MEDISLIKPFFTIITCTYNSAIFVENNIRSVKEQSYTDFEHIFIDGNSTDTTLDKIRKYQNKYPQKVMLYARAPKGISNAFNDTFL